MRVAAVAYGLMAIIGASLIIVGVNIGDRAGSLLLGAGIVVLSAGAYALGILTEMARPTPKKGAEAEK